MPAAFVPRAREGKRTGRAQGCCRDRPRWTSEQACSHAGTVYVITSFAVCVQPEWMARGGDRGAQSPQFVVVFWVVFVLSLALYMFVCTADTEYKGGSASSMKRSHVDDEVRRCEMCSPNIKHLRVRHCQTCSRCTDGFDHHCRYLNVCIASRTYLAWYAFVVGLTFIMTSSCWGAVAALAQPSDYRLASLSPALFIAILGMQAVVSLLSTIFLVILLAQHTYFMLEGKTTLEHVKEQAAGFPALPPRGWREAVAEDLCFRCGEGLELVHVGDPNEVWFCSICQADIAKAGIACWTCEECDNVNVCPLCRSAARERLPVVTYRVSTLKRRAQSQATDKAVGEQMSNGCPSRYSSFASQRDVHRKRRIFSTVVAAVEGHTGDGPRSSVCCCCPGSGEKVGEATDAGEESDSSDSSSEQAAAKLNGDF